jgi:hypothetical protein
LAEFKNMPEFDVYLTGARDGSPSSQLRTAAAIATRFRVPAPEVAAALAGSSYRVGERLARAEAQAMADALAALGGVARISPSDPLSGVHVPDRRRITLKSADAHHPPVVVDVAEEMEFAEPGPEGRTGVRGADIVRCPIHGLNYNRRQASGCVRCLAPARARAKTLEGAGVTGAVDADADADAETSAPVRTGWLRKRFASPARRALWGVLVALVLGFLPAAYHARATTGRKTAELRAEQGRVATESVTVASLARFDALDAEVHAIHLRGAGETLLIWIAVSGAVAFAWSRVT